MKKFIVAFVTILAMFSMSACAPDSGNVYAKEYHEGYYKTVSVDDYHYSCNYEYDPFKGENGGFRNVCKDRWVGSHNEQRWVEECYEVKFKNEDGDKGDDCVGRDRYEALNIGDFFEK